LDQGEPGETKEDQERYPQEEEKLKICVSNTPSKWESDEHTARHGKSHGVLPPAFETGKKGAMPEPVVRTSACWTKQSNTAWQFFRYCTFIAILSVLLHRHSSHTSKTKEYKNEIAPQ
jgi:hypothetical protein